MNMNKKLDRFKHWAGERMGGEVRTNVSDDFKALEAEMGLRQEGTKKNHQSMNDYIKSISKKNEGGDREKLLPIGALGTAMASHGDEFEPNSDFGLCLSAMGRTHERLARVQETYVTKASSTWLDSLERSVAQMKEYQNARKKLESRRLAFDTAAAKMEKAKREDFRAEEELRSQRAKYEEASEDTHRRMLDIKDAEVDSVLDLKEFLEAELNYHERCREILLQLREDWPARQNHPNQTQPRSRSSTNGSYRERFNGHLGENQMPPPQPPRPLRSGQIVSNSLPQSPVREFPAYDFGSGRPGVNRSVTYDMSSRARDASPASSTHSVPRIPSDSLSIRTQKAQLRSVSRPTFDPYNDQSDASTYYSNDADSPDRYVDDRSFSPSTSYESVPSRSFSGTSVSGKKPPPPPPRAKKPPPPPPMKRATQAV